MIFKVFQMNLFGKLGETELAPGNPMYTVHIVRLRPHVYHERSKAMEKLGCEVHRGEVENSVKPRGIIDMIQPLECSMKPVVVIADASPGVPGDQTRSHDKDGQTCFACEVTEVFGDELGLGVAGGVGGSHFPAFANVLVQGTELLSGEKVAGKNAQGGNV